MPQKNATYKNLADIVHLKLKNASTPHEVPKIDVINEIFETLFFTSLKTEESQFIKVTITYINPENPDPIPTQILDAKKWQSSKFEKNIQFNVKELAKLSKAADIWSSSLAVYSKGDGEIYIWGMIDQALHSQSFLNYESFVEPKQPGLFQASIKGVGSIEVLFECELLAELKQNQLIYGHISVFEKGKIAEFIKLNASYHLDIASHSLSSAGILIGSSDVFDFCWLMHNETISRILLRVQNYHHGGSIIITSQVKQDLNIKFKLNYQRLTNALESNIFKTIEQQYYSDIINEDHINGANNFIEKDLFLNEKFAYAHLHETNLELTGAIRFVSSLSCVDGAVVLSPQLGVYGFGAVITSKECPPIIHISKYSEITVGKIETQDIAYFGTRHQSMFAYCWNNPDSLGFVISQDGDIRAVKRVNDKLFMWENIKVHQFIRSNRLKRNLRVKK
jgi:hypothetical protein